MTQLPLLEVFDEDEGVDAVAAAVDAVDAVVVLVELVLVEAEVALVSVAVLDDWAVVAAELAMQPVSTTIPARLAAPATRRARRAGWGRRRRLAGVTGR
jgi:hypothetical protein